MATKPKRGSRMGIFTVLLSSMFQTTSISGVWFLAFIALAAYFIAAVAIVASVALLTQKTKVTAFGFESSCFVRRAYHTIEHEQFLSKDIKARWQKTISVYVFTRPFYLINTCAGLVTFPQLRGSKLLVLLVPGR